MNLECDCGKKASRFVDGSAVCEECARLDGIYVQELSEEAVGQKLEPEIAQRYGNKQFKKYGKCRGTGLQRYLCNDCGATFCDYTGTIYGKLRIAAERASEILISLGEGSGIRETARRSGCAKSQVGYFIGVIGSRCDKVMRGIVKKDEGMRKLEQIILMRRKAQRQSFQNLSHMKANRENYESLLLAYYWFCAPEGGLGYPHRLTADELFWVLRPDTSAGDGHVCGPKRQWMVNLEQAKDQC